MDELAFLPLTAKEITSADIPRRYIQLSNLVLDITKELIDAGICGTMDKNSKTILTTNFRPGDAGRFLRLNAGAGIRLSFDCNRWLKFGRTPIWL